MESFSVPGPPLQEVALLGDRPGDRLAPGRFVGAGADPPLRPELDVLGNARPVKIALEAAADGR